MKMFLFNYQRALFFGHLPRVTGMWGIIELVDLKSIFYKTILVASLAREYYSRNQLYFQGILSFNNWKISVAICHTY